MVNEIVVIFEIQKTEKAISGVEVEASPAHNISTSDCLPASI